MTSQRVDVRGPNLPNKLANRGDMHAHAEGCADLRRYPTGADQGGWVTEVGSLEDLAYAVYGDQIRESEEQDWTEYLAEIYVAPCVKLV